MEDREKTRDEIIDSFADIAEDQAKHGKSSHKRDEFKNYPQSRVTENKIQGYFFLGGIIVVGLFFAIALLS
jgi:hypothetical protein